MTILIMGISGTGKSTIADRVSRLYACSCIEADDYHLASSIQKMQHGIPLQDADREPWLRTLNRRLLAMQHHNQDAVIACSALTERYRRILLKGILQPRIICLHGSRDRIYQRISDRRGHFMPPELLDSQLNTLQLPERGLILDISDSIEQILTEIQHYILTFRDGTA
ncbi:gluconokinase [Spirochaeta africana]|uniref:Gluconokinase n=1 Tax=Spirochaeta africana (strain ATCC 700263 / DSM 8902 / Z-7692) TaxID=889378 RepID=H9UL39_SPIAZ|nr:gluconokinase, GntK/IdnK-type [Spirochaeta africana]AFG38232.1 carbohydrate kinase, thermoresistant glucokinase family [Spirochaeta africana DSM 8902]